MSGNTQLMLFIGMLWASGIGVFLWIRWRLKKDSEAEQAAREAWAAVVPRSGCRRDIPGCICARENLGDQCIWRQPDPH